MIPLDTRQIYVLPVILVYTIWNCDATSYPFSETNSLGDLLKHLFMNDSLKPAFKPSQNRISRSEVDSSAQYPSFRQTSSTIHDGLQTIHVHNNFFLISNPHELNIDIVSPSPPTLSHPIRTNAADIDRSFRDKSPGFTNDAQSAVTQSPTYHHEVPTISSSSSADLNHLMPAINGGLPNAPLKDNMLKTEKHCSELENDSPFSNIYIDGKKFGEGACLKNPSYDESSFVLPPKNTLPEAVNPIPNNAKHILHCIPETDPHCKPDSISFDGGLKIPYQDIRNMFELISQQPENIKLIVPGGISGPLANYFQKVDRSRHEQAAKYGVCVFPNGLLVPIKPMLRILQLHFWLLQSSNDANTRDGNALHRSITWSNMECVLEILRCLIKANIVFVRMPGNEVLPYTQFVSNERVIPHEVLRHCIAEILGVSVPYLQFTNALLQLQQIASIRSQTPSNVHG